ncbi:MAG TPA: 4-hydroxybenzoate octaprenyltransferase, partial [Rhodobiaceae bacterium]|nr:4-hydroxybenzoate octaprenyltransferase [Rhodobiaceae bacterium]
LLLPCWWSLALASEGWPSLLLLFLFLVGAIAMRGAGCTWNDIVDRDIDAAVARTRLRPIPSGAVSVRQAWAFLLAQCLVGLCVLLFFNNFAILLGFSSLILVAIYPFMKRITYWPQFVLGLAFNWGALMGWAAVKGELSLAPVLLYLGAVAWTVGYDTIYALQDREDDAL